MDFSYKRKNKSGADFEFQRGPGELNYSALVIAVGLIAVIIITGCIGNLMTILAVKKNKKLQTISNTFIVNLSVCDMIAVCCILPFNVYTYLVDGWFINEYLCKFVGFLGYTVTGTTIITITLIAYNRYKLVLDPGIYTLIYTKATVTWMLSAAWIIPVVCLLPAIFEIWGKFGYVPMLVTCNLSVDDKSQLFKLFLLVVRAVIPCILIIYLYVMIFRTTQASHKRLNAASIRKCSSVDIHNNKKELHLTKMMVTIFIVFIISYFPCTVTGIIEWKIILSKNFHVYCEISVYIGCAVNPIIYGLMNTQFKKAFKNILTCSNELRDVNNPNTKICRLQKMKNCDQGGLVLISTAGIDKNSLLNSECVESKSSSKDESCFTRVDLKCNISRKMLSMV